MGLFGRIREWLHPACRECGVAHGSLMTLDMRGRLRVQGPRAVVMRHYAREIEAARKLARFLGGGNGRV